MRRTLLLRSALGLAALGLWADPAQAALTLSTDAAADLEVKVLAMGLSQPTDVAELPDGRVVITQRLGDVVVVDKNGDQIESGTIMVYPEFGEQGLLGVVADPDFATNHYLYFYASAGTTSDDPKNKHKVFRIVLGDDGMLGERTTIIDKGLRASRSSVDGGASNHNGGGLQIYKGKLFLSVGDTGHNKTPPNNELGTCLNATNGKILRVNLDGSVPDDNPLSNETMVTGCDDWNTATKDEAPEKKIFAWGFRNPYRFWIDPMTSRMWIGDVGETTKEEVSVGSPIDGTGAGAKGEHFGWPFAEGTTKYTQSFPAASCMDVKPARDCVPPVYDYGHGMNNNCVIGGLIPDGCGWKAPWNARYLFGDNGSGRIWYLDVNADRSGVTSTTTKDFASSQGVGSFRMGANGTLYIAEVSGGVVDKITPKGLDPAMCGGSSGGTGGMGAGGAAAGSTSSGGVAGGSSGGISNGGNAGSAPTGGRTGTSGGGGVPASGGSGTGGAPTGGSSAAKGGTGPAMGGTSTAGTTASGGSTATAGNGAANAAGSGGSSGDDKSGCGCRVGGDAPSSTSLMALSGLLGLMAFRRRRSRAAR